MHDHAFIVYLQIERGAINLAGAKVQYTEDKQQAAAVSALNTILL